MNSVDDRGSDSDDVAAVKDNYPSHLTLLIRIYRNQDMKIISLLFMYLMLYHNNNV